MLMLKLKYYIDVVYITFFVLSLGTPEEPFKIAGYEDERPLWDGTVTIQPGSWDYDPDSGICSAGIGIDITALFYKDDLLTAARWPNGKWSDKSIFVNKEAWRPDGCCGASVRGTIVDNALSEANLDFTGAMAVLNIGSWETYVRIVVEGDSWLF